MPTSTNERTPRCSGDTAQLQSTPSAFAECGTRAGSSRVVRNFKGFRDFKAIANATTTPSRGSVGAVHGIAHAAFVGGLRARSLRDNDAGGFDCEPFPRDPLSEARPHGFVLHLDARAGAYMSTSTAQGAGEPEDSLRLDSQALQRTYEARLIEGEESLCGGAKLVRCCLIFKNEESGAGAAYAMWRETDARPTDLRSPEARALFAGHRLHAALEDRVPLLSISSPSCPSSPRSQTTLWASGYYSLVVDFMRRFRTVLIGLLVALAPVPIQPEVVEGKELEDMQTMRVGRGFLSPDRRRGIKTNAEKTKTYSWAGCDADSLPFDSQAPRRMSVSKARPFADEDDNRPAYQAPTRIQEMERAMRAVLYAACRGTITLGGRTWSFCAAPAALELVSRYSAPYPYPYSPRRPPSPSRYRAIFVLEDLLARRLPRARPIHPPCPSHHPLAPDTFPAAPPCFVARSQFIDTGRPRKEGAEDVEDEQDEARWVVVVLYSDWTVGALTTIIAVCIATASRKRSKKSTARHPALRQISEFDSIRTSSTTRVRMQDLPAFMRRTTIPEFLNLTLVARRVKDWYFRTIHTSTAVQFLIPGK
ncbi:hypothetical protein C8R45DRAFT_1069699 [Mycena sanguinolenta]|nr:hypothetical protein C8R45DRAFT_1069699 [Mycena sanguinolenta]